MEELLAAQAIPALADTGYGIYQALKGYNAQANLARPKYEIPQEIKDNLSDAQRMALQGMPEAQQKIYIDNIQRGMNQGLNALGSRQAGVAGVGLLNQNQNDAYRQLLGMSSQQQMGNMGQLYSARNSMADYKNQAFDLNQMQPYQNQAAMAQAMIGAGTQNIHGGLTSIAGGANNLSTASMMSGKTWQELLGGGTSDKTTEGLTEAEQQYIYNQQANANYLKDKAAAEQNIPGATNPHWNSFLNLLNPKKNIPSNPYSSNFSY